MGREQDAGPAVVIIPLMYLVLVALMTFNSLKGDKKSEVERNTIMRGLPRFCNQLYLMMNAGLILSDAFDTISTGCESNIERSTFENDLISLREATDGHRISTAQVISDYAVKHDVKEMIRIAAILTENEKRGSDVIESLERESRYLWDERKTVARECGKAIDTKMSYPLGLLLIVLIVITMAPALMNI
jgi:type II secretory pathway component PulF